MHSRNDVPPHNNSGGGGGIEGGEGRYVPFSSSGGARPLPYPFGRGQGWLSSPCREKGEDGGASQTPNIEDLIKKTVWEALEKASTTAASGTPAPATAATETETGAEAGGTPAPTPPSPPLPAPPQPRTFPSPTEQ